MFTSLITQIAARKLAQSDIQIGGSRPWDIQIHDASALTDGLIRGSLGLGDSYCQGKWDVERLDLFFERILSSPLSDTLGISDYMLRARDFILNTQVGKRAFQVGERHYDLGNELYEYMLGESMGYSCGIYESETSDLTQAQYLKFDTLCRRLRLTPGMRILEIGAGWGTFARHAAREYGVHVTGLTVSREQLAYATERCHGLPVDFILTDYRDLDHTHDHLYDRVVSIEMIEAVGRKNMQSYFDMISRVLKPDGLVGIQAILGHGKEDAFISTRIFPNGHVPSIIEITHAIEHTLRIKHWESIGRDYDRTLMAWDENFRTHWPKIKSKRDRQGKHIYDEHFYRMWRYYLMCCAASFRTGYIDDAQIILSHLHARTVLK